MVKPAGIGTQNLPNRAVYECFQLTLVGIFQSIIDDIRNGWYTHKQIDQAVADAEVSKNGYRSRV